MVQLSVSWVKRLLCARSLGLARGPHRVTGHRYLCMKLGPEASAPHRVPEVMTRGQSAMCALGPDFLLCPPCCGKRTVPSAALVGGTEGVPDTEHTGKAGIAPPPSVNKLAFCALNLGPKESVPGRGFFSSCVDETAEFVSTLWSV